MSSPDTRARYRCWPAGAGASGLCGPGAGKQMPVTLKSPPTARPRIATTRPSEEMGSTGAPDSGTHY